MVRTEVLRGHAAVWLENDQLQALVLPNKGADVYRLIHRPSGVDFLYKTRLGLVPPSADRPLDVVEDYEGGWQELFPNTGDACEYRGVALPVHGEVAVLPWAYEVLPEEDASVRFWVETRRTPFRLERWMRLCPGRPKLDIEETVTHLGDAPIDFVWGHHIVLGGTFLEAGCRYETTAHTIIVPDQPKETAHARLAPGQRSGWPMAKARRAGETIDLSRIPGPEARSHDEVYLTDLETGQASVHNARLGLTFQLEWDLTIFGCLVMWQPFGGIDVPPWDGSYGVGFEPWTTDGNLASALARGKALRLAAGESLSTHLTINITEHMKS